MKREQTTLAEALELVDTTWPYHITDAKWTWEIKTRHFPLFKQALKQLKCRWLKEFHAHTQWDKEINIVIANNEARYTVCYLFKRNMESLISKENSQFFNPVRKPEQSPTSAELRVINRSDWRAMLGCSQCCSIFTTQKMRPAGSHSWSILYNTHMWNSHTFALICYLLADAN